MQRDVPSGVLLIAGSLMGIFAMSLHPTAHDVLSGSEGARQLRVNMLVHGVARRLDPSRLSTAALVAWACGGFAVMIAAVASGFVATDLMQQLLELPLTEPAARERLHALLGYTHTWNQAFTRVFIAAGSAAFLLWSCAILRTGRLSRALGAAGLVAGLGIALAVQFRLVRLDVHGFGLIVLAQSAWYVWAAMLLMRGDRA
jgi:hypothetical protein